MYIEQDPSDVNSVERLKACQVGPYSSCAYKYPIRAIRCQNNDVIYQLDQPIYPVAAYCFGSMLSLFRTK